MKKFLIVLLLLALSLSACAAVPSEPGSGSESSGEGSPTPGPSEPSSGEETPIQPEAPVTETQDPDEPVSSEDTPDPDATQRSPLDPLPDEERMIRGNVFLESTDILVLESFPVQIVLHLTGQLPSPCHNLRAQMSEPDEQGRIQVEVYSLVDPAVMCAQVIKDFDTRINLGSFPSGTYTLWVNGEQVGEFTA